jgi:hypothetical protein
VGAVPVQEIATATADGVTAITKAYTSNVTAGNLLVITCGRFNATQVAFTAADCTMSAGTATLGTITLDTHAEATPTEAIESAVWSVPVLVGGSVTIRIAGSTGAYFELNINEYSSVDVSGTRVAGTPTSGSSNTGTSPATAAGVTTSSDSLFIGAVATDYAGTNLAPVAGNSFTLIGSSVNGTLHQTGASVRKIVTGASTDSLSVSLATTSLNGWCACLVAYKAAAASVLTVAPNLSLPTRPLNRVIGRTAIALRAPRRLAAAVTSSFPSLNIDSSQSVSVGGAAAVVVLTQLTSSQGVPIGGTATATVLDQVASTQPIPLGGSAAIAVLEQATSTQQIPVSGAATIAVAEQITSSQSVALGGSIAVNVLEQLTSTQLVPIGGGIGIGVAVQVSSTRAVPINGAIGAGVLVQITSTQQIPIGGSISGGSGGIVTSAASILVGGSIAASVLDQLTSSAQILLGGSAAVSVRLQVTSVVPVPLSGLIAAAVGIVASSGAVIPLSGSIAVSVAAAFTGTHLDEPLSIDFVSLASAIDFAKQTSTIDFAPLATAIDFTQPTTAIDFDSLETVLVFLDGGTEVFELTIIKGELTPIAMTLRGASPTTGDLLPYDVTAATSVKLNAGKSGATLIINAKDLAKTDAANGRVTYNPAIGETDVAGKYEALVVATFAGAPGVVRKFPGKLTIKDAIA